MIKPMAELDAAISLAHSVGGKTYYSPDNCSMAMVEMPIVALAALIADVRRQDRNTVDMIEMSTPDDIKGRFQSELFWRGAYAMRDAIRAKMEEGK
jgi:hypothetical protein